MENLIIKNLIEILEKDFYGIEACLFEDEKDIEILANEAEQKDYKFGIHFPLRAGISKLRDPQFLSLNEGIKKSAYNHIEEELIYMKQKHISPNTFCFTILNLQY